MRKLVNYLLSAGKIFKEFFADYASYMNYSMDGRNVSPTELTDSRILLVAHSLEKGMSFANKRKGWGEQKAFFLLNLLKTVDAGKIDEPFILGLNVLYKYSLDKEASKNENLISGIKNITASYKQYLDPKAYGIKVISEPPTFDKKTISEFFSSRSSVRYFSDKPVTDEEIKEAAKIANETPTACNRQTCKIYAYRNPEQIKKILDNQLGDQGWASGANTLFVITSNLSRFGGTYEHSQALIDGGLFAMNFDWGLHLQHIASCFKMYVRESKRQKEFLRICEINPNEVPIVLILAGHYKDTAVYGPVSHRFSNDIIIKN